MDLESVYNQLWIYAEHNMAVALVVFAILAIMMFIKPKFILKIVAVLAAAVVCIYLFNFISETIFTGAESKNNMIHKTRDVVGE